MTDASPYLQLQPVSKLVRQEETNACLAKLLTQPERNLKVAATDGPKRSPKRSRKVLP